MKAFKLIVGGSKQLKNKNIVSNQLDSEILMSKVLNTSREKLLINLNQNITSKKVEKFKSLIKRRSTQEPIAYILKNKEFWSNNFIVDKKTLIPRPETELLVEKIVKIFKNKSIFILDIGTGTGCILLSILSELNTSRGVGIDISSQAVQIAKVNLSKHNMNCRAKFYKRSLNELNDKKFDLIVSNPPYIMTKDIKNLQLDIKKFEPKIALDGGNDGLDVIKKVIYKSKCVLKIKGTLALEIGNGQLKKVSKILGANNFKVRHLVRDYRQNIRCILSTLEKWFYKIHSMNNNRRRNFRSRSQKNNFRRRNNAMNSNGNNNFNNGNLSFGRNGSMNNPHNVEKAIQKFQQLAKDAQSNGDPVLVENYLQHADHYSRRLSELNEKSKDLTSSKEFDASNTSNKET